MRGQGTPEEAVTFRQIVLTIGFSRGLYTTHVTSNTKT
jgi:hypothetical protein